ncbi:hypothetical protein PBY51_019320 [Eleginops maclovinus]|uniref:Uncharacterized protein n=1 Tax=Eleginops maclovinus TaxID=56733 RepID=A0AAN8AYP2_ELEMC|nr:hypothetical protein PBY51_019320 [Eleginops maclovinus]
MQQLAARLLAGRGTDSTVHEAGTISTGKVRNREVRVADRSNLGHGENHDDHIFQQHQISMAAVMVLGERSILVISGSGSLP